ncbi:Variant-specific surface protein [Giardia duodenalis]|uniref:Variant-specific surface protein n=1 Tax=Giardia intestinalis TaxID=5741 RepID=V6TVF4_GIAIN|nr:Variant-specific surface protein [Giardia intestinalis]
MGGCYGICVAGSGVCREARDGECVMYREMGADEGHSIGGGRRGTQGSRTNDSTKEGKRAKAAATCTPTTNSNSPTSGDCTENACNVQIGSNVYCSQCAKQGEVPIDGTCTAKDSAIDKCKKDANTELAGTEQVCGACKDGYFLHKGGCYQFGGEVGKLICTDPSTSDGSLAAGTCTACAPGYFKNPTTVSAAVPPCIACNDETGDGTSMGKAGCATCEAPTSEATATCTTCTDGYYGTAAGSGVTSTQCTDPCATCTASGTDKCTSCKDASDKQYFKKGESNDGTGTCVSEETCNTDSTHFPTTDANQKKICALCSDATNRGIDGCKTCTLKTAASLAETPSVTCSVCTTEGKKLNADGTACFLCPDKGVTAGCSSCSADNTCEACVPGKILKTDGSTKTCVAEAECTAGFFVSTASNVKTCISCGAAPNGVTDCATCEARADDKAKAKCLSCTGTKKPNTTGTACVACTIADCANCDKENVCTKCVDSKIVKTAADVTSCVTDDECTKAEGFFVKDGSTKTCEACSDENCATCAATGMNQCSKCKTTGTKTYLKGSAGAGTCVEASQCGSGFFPKADNSAGNKCVSCASTSGNDGGVADCQTCSKTETTLKCLTCSDPKKPSTDGTKCVTCTVTNCATCSANDACEVCTDGYRKTDSNTCEKCTVNKCKACASDINACTECVEGYTLEGGNCASSSANKSGLSTGAIVGISVAAVVACSVPLTGCLSLHNEQSRQNFIVVSNLLCSGRACGRVQG